MIFVWVIVVYIMTFYWEGEGGPTTALNGRPYTVHKLNDCLHPVECIPETQFLMRSKINLGMLLHMWRVCEQEEGYS